MKMVRSDLASSAASCSRSTPRRASATSFSSPPPTAWARTSSRAPSTRTSSTSSSRRLEPGHRAVLRRTLGSKEIKMVYVEGGARKTDAQRPTTPKADRARFCLSDDEVLTLAGYAVHDRTALQPQAGRPTRWTWSGPRTASTASSTWCRHVPRPWPRSTRRNIARGTTCSKARGEMLVDRPRGRRRGSAAGAARRDPSRAASSPSSSPARCWSPT